MTERKTPAPEERPLPDPGDQDLSWRDYVAIVRRAVKQIGADNITLIAQALAYSAFLAIPSVLLVVAGVFTLVASAHDITSLMNHVGHIVPAQAKTLVTDSLQRLNNRPSTGVTMTIVGFVLALWATTGAMTALITGLNIAHGKRETRSFVRRRLVALELVALMAVAFVLVFGLLVLGPQLSRWIGNAVGLQSTIGWIWWIAQWPLLVGGLMLVFATVHYLGPNFEHPRWQLITPGAVVAMVVWLAASGLFAVYTSRFGSYNKTWGSLAAVIILLTWLWLTSLAILLGAEINAEAERSTGAA
ncbi:MAG: YihY/virulence factor BrkB family protein [Gaiellaceae bacterium]